MDCNGNTVARSVLISGLKRSGTTVLWETFRKDLRNRCFDEPLNPDLWKGRLQNSKGTWNELGEFWERQTPARNAGLQAIYPADELVSSNTGFQREYLRSLMLDGSRTVIDDVRIWNRLPDLLPHDVPTVAVHLLREPLNWVTAQMLPGRRRPWPASMAWQVGVCLSRRITAT